jgi:hypothetical protein
MAEKKTTKAAAPKAAPKAAPAKKAAAPAKKVEVYFDAVNAGFKAGEVYQVLAAADKAMTVAEIAKKAKASNEEVILGIGWLLKEGKVTSVDNKIVLA